MVGVIGAASAIATRAETLNIPVFTARLEPDAQTLAMLRGKDVLAFAGIGDPPKFFAMLATAGVRVGAAHAFPDHHRYSTVEAERLLVEADRHGCVLVTTEKDLVRIAREPHLEILAQRVQPLPVELVLDRPAEFERFVSSVLQGRTPGTKQGERSNLQGAEPTDL